MIECVNEFSKELVTVTENAERCCFATRAKELQIEAIEQLQTLMTKGKELKVRIISERAEDLANRMFSYEQVLQALSNELQMWVALKEDRSDEAWDALVEAEVSARIAMRAHEASKHLWGYLKRLKVIEALLFPPITFTSVGVLVKHSTCSICKEEYGDCDHLKGKVYMGELCAEVIHDARLLEVSIVPEPANRHCRILTYTDGGITRDTLTLRAINTGPEKHDREAEIIFSTEIEAIS
jgi:hypothetical protein